MQSIKLNENVIFNKKTVRSMDELESIEAEVSTIQPGTFIFFLDMSLNNCDKYKEVILRIRDRSPVLLVVNEEIQENIVVNLIKIFNGIIYAKDMNTPAT